MIPSRLTLLACLLAALSLLGCVGMGLGWKAAHDRETELSAEIEATRKVAKVVDRVVIQRQEAAKVRTEQHEVQNAKIDKAVEANRDWASRPLPDDVFASLRN